VVKLSVVKAGKFFMGQMLYEELTGKIIGAFYQVYNDLGYGFLEKVYENALAHKLRQAGLTVQQQHPIKVYYEGLIVGEFYADMLVDERVILERVILELKTAEAIAPAFQAQLINYLKATPIELGLLLNFGPKPEFKRQLLTNDRKPGLKSRKNP
jgi:GxxExxY protein